MEKHIVIPTLFSPILQFVVYHKCNQIVFEIHDNYQKQTYRNRYYIYGPNGIQLLSVPVNHSSFNQKIKTKDIQIDYSVNWQKLHIKSLDSAYSSSPFYEFYRDDIIPLIDKKHKYLIDFNFDTFYLLTDLLELDLLYSNTKEYVVNFKDKDDFKYLSNAKQKTNWNFTEYTQVFHQKHGFISNLSILDLLFNEGPNSSYYLEKQLLAE